MKFFSTENFYTVDYDFDERTLSSDITAHQHSYFEVDLYLRGEGVLTINDKSYNIKRGSFSFVMPMGLHAISLTADAHFLHFAFTNNSIRDPQIFNLLMNTKNFCTCLNEEEITYMSSLLKNFHSHCTNEYPYNKIYLSHLLECIIMEFIVHSSDKKNTFEADPGVIPPPILDALSYINANFLSDISLNDAACSCGLSKNHFSEIFHKYIGVTFKQYIINLRLEYAAKLIAVTRLPIHEIAYMAGYNSLPNFLRSFRQKYGVSPKKYAEINSQGSNFFKS